MLYPDGAVSAWNKGPSSCPCKDWLDFVRQPHRYGQTAGAKMKSKNDVAKPTRFSFRQIGTHHAAALDDVAMPMHQSCPRPSAQARPQIIQSMAKQ